MDLLPAALAFTSKGYNAFANYDAISARADEAINAREWARSGLSRKQIIEALSELTGIQDERSIRRRLAEGRQSALAKLQVNDNWGQPKE